MAKRMNEHMHTCTDVLKGGVALAVPTGTWNAHWSWLKRRGK